MNRTTKLLCLPALLALALFVLPARAGDPEKAETLDSKIDRLLRQVGELQQQVDRQQRDAVTKDDLLDLRLRMTRNVLDFDQRLERLEKGRVSNYPSTPAAVTPEQEQLLQSRLERLERELRDVQKRSAFYPSTDIVTPSPAIPVPATGSVRIQNLSLMPSTVRVNGMQYVVAGGQTLTIPNLPAGALFTYEVLADARGGYHSPRVRTVPANGAFDIFINP